jgi:hypothetical protein
MRTNRLTLTKGENYSAYMPWSEACVWMKVAGKRMWFRIVGDEYPMVQLLYRPDDAPPTSPLLPFSFPITLGEGGVFHQDGEFYCYPEMNGPPTPASGETDVTSDAR